MNNKLYLCDNMIADKELMMMDIINKEKRSQLMSHIRSNDTEPEMIVRHKLHSSGYRFRLHCKELPGKPDIVLPKYRSVIFINGCFWHNHKDCPKSKLPTSNVSFWLEKIMSNVVRDEKNYALLNMMSWQVIILWECEIKSKKYENKLFEYLNTQR
jgi:DNA mismatch endonuclease, patch repair protein